MKLIINNQQVHGDVEDLAAILKCLNPALAKRQIPVKEAPQTPLDESLKQSAELRKQLESGVVPNPYPGVLPSSEPNIPEQQFNRNYAADADTGVTYE